MKAPKTHPLAVSLIGDHLVACPRDGIGLAPLVAERLRVPVLDASACHGLRDVYRTLPAALRDLVEVAQYDGDDPRLFAAPVVVATLGAADARGGGPAPWAYVQAIVAMRRIVEGWGCRFELIWSPPCPDGIGDALPGYARESRRWLSRMPRRLDDAGLGFTVPDIPADSWADQLTIRRPGQEALIAAIVSRVSGVTPEE